jgi:hypothetical protein
MAGNRRPAPEVTPSPRAQGERERKVTGARTRTRVAPETVAVARQVLSAQQASPQQADREAMRNSLLRNEARGERVTVLVANMPDEDGTPRVWLGEPHNDKRGWLIRLQDAFGTHSDEFAARQLNALATLARQNGDGTVDGEALNSMLAAVDGVRPQNEVEAMLAVQMATTHAFAMTMPPASERGRHNPAARGERESRDQDAPNVRGSGRGARQAASGRRAASDCPACERERRRPGHCRKRAQPSQWGRGQRRKPRSTPCTRSTKPRC